MPLSKSRVCEYMLSHDATRCYPFDKESDAKSLFPHKNEHPSQILWNIREQYVALGFNPLMKAEIEICNTGKDGWSAISTILV